MRALSSAHRRLTLPRWVLVTVIAGAVAASQSVGASDATMWRFMRQFAGAADAPAEALVLRGTAFVPLRSITDWLGADLVVGPGGREMTIRLAGKTAELRVGSTAARANGKPVTLDPAAVRRDGRTYFPLRFMAEALGCEVAWDAKANRGTIKHPLSGELLPVIVAPSATKGLPMCGEWLAAGPDWLWFSFRVVEGGSAMEDGMVMIVEGELPHLSMSARFMDRTPVSRGRSDRRSFANYAFTGQFTSATTGQVSLTPQLLDWVRDTAGEAAAEAAKHTQLAAERLCGAIPPTPPGHAELLRAVTEGRLVSAEEALSKWPNCIQARDEGGATSLHIAARKDSSELVGLLLEAHLSANVRDRHGRTPLHLAAAAGYREIVELLIAHSGDPNVRDGDGRTALQHAQAAGQHDLAAYLAECTGAK